MLKKLFGRNKDKKSEEVIEKEIDKEVDKEIEKEIEDKDLLQTEEVKSEEQIIASEEIKNDTDNKSEIQEVINQESAWTHEQVDQSEDLESKPKKKLSFIDKLKNGLSKTRNAVSSSIDNLINGKAEIDDDLYEELEEVLISADIGVETTVQIIDDLRDHIEKNHIRDPKLIKENLITLMKDKLESKNINNELNFEDGKPLVLLVIGVNGVGKTTTIGKLAYNLINEGKTVTLAAADTFRAAAIQQLTEWANRAGVEIVSHAEGSDPASVVFDAIDSHKAKGKDVLIIDTAGRLHNKKNLMNELEKINRIISKQYPQATRETLLVLDATTGQNAIYQAKEFNKVSEISGLVLTKLDGTAKGGVVFPLQVENQIPVKFIGVGEGIDNLERFQAADFVEAMFN